MPAQLAREFEEEAVQPWLVSQVVVSGPVRDSLRAHATRAYPEEACGLLIGRIEAEEVLITRAVPCPNQAPLAERHHRFSIDPRAVINVRRTLRGSPESVVGFYHSHTNGRAVPSALDVTHIRLWPETVWVIVPEGGEPGAAPRAWWLDEREAEVRELTIEVAALGSGRLVCPE
ncbi:MAG TPA: M67 family metallopeptidase [Longimicrobiaceae bacterium]